MAAWLPAVGAGVIQRRAPRLPGTANEITLSRWPRVGRLTIWPPRWWRSRTGFAVIARDVMVGPKAVAGLSLLRIPGLAAARPRSGGGSGGGNYLAPHHLRRLEPRFLSPCDGRIYQRPQRKSPVVPCQAGSEGTLAAEFFWLHDIQPAHALDLQTLAGGRAQARG